MSYKIRAILDVEKDVIRDILIAQTDNLEILHKSIANAFGFNGQEMASFYRSDSDWNQGDEIPLFDMSDDGDSLSMQKSIVKDEFLVANDKLIYVYDFMSMWTFFIELTEITSDDDIDEPKIIFAFGDVPEMAPEKEFVAEDIDTRLDFDESEFNDFENLDNIDDYNF